MNYRKLVHDRFCENGLEGRASALTPLVSECVRFKSSPDESVACGASKLGGTPDTPESFKWPVHDGKPMLFLAQLNLADFAEFECCSDLPKSGLLSFFYSQDCPWGYEKSHHGSWLVSLFDDVQLHSAKTPKGSHSFKNCRLTARLGLSYPEWDTPAVLSLNMDLNESNTYIGVPWEDLDSEQETGYRHQLLGHPHNTQASMEAGLCNVTEDLYTSTVDDWQLLFELDSDENPEWCWCDMGRLYFWIRKCDLQESRFENVWAKLQTL